MLAIEPPGAAAPIPPQPKPEDVKVVPLEAPDAGQVVPLEDPKAYLGVGTSQVPGLLGEHLGLDAGQGVVVRALDANGPAAKSGIAQNDVITKVDGNSIGSHEQLRDVIGGMKPDDEVDVEFIHRGKVGTAKIALGTAPELPPALAAGDVKPLDRLLLDGMPQDQAKRLREEIERNLREFEGDPAGNGAFPEQMIGEEMHKRLKMMLQGMNNADAFAVPGNANGELKIRSAGTFRMIDPDGSGVELRSMDGGKEVRILGPGGKVEWEGPYDTPQDREAVPQEYRPRIEKLNIDTDFQGNGLKLRFGKDVDPDGE